MPAAPSITAVIVAAGSGNRLGAVLPKAFVDLGGKPLFFHSLAVFCSYKKVTETILVVAESMIKKASEIIARSGIDTPVRVIAGGQERWMSVKNAAVAASGEWLLVHDAARPFVTAPVIDTVIAKSAEFACVITATPETDTVRTSANGVAGVVVDRSTLVRVGTPQLFKRELLLEAFLKLEEGTGSPLSSRPPTDEAMLVQALGIPVGLAEGDPINFKITTSADLEIAEALIAKRRG
jgi:2-C-methyl-D-erythritol 4-phosphate cytidylyltransferase